MHAVAGTIGHDLITDEYARQQARQASRERFYDDNGRAVNVIIVDDPAVATRTSGTSTPSTPASPPHDAEADREAKRLEAAAHLKFLALVRAWADGEGADLPVKADPALRTSIRGLVENLEHLARQAKADQDAWVRTGLLTTAAVRRGQAAAYRETALLVRDLLR